MKIDISNSKVRRFLLQFFFIVFNFVFILGTLAIVTGLDNTGNKANTDNNLKELKFVQISDVHLDSNARDKSGRLYADSKELFQDAVSYINNVNNVDFVIFSGDSINRPVASDFEKFFSISNKLEYPWYLSTGNHEIGIKGGLSKTKRLDLLKKYNKNFTEDKSYYSFTPKQGYHVIVMDGVIDTKTTANAYYPEKELAWLDRELTNNKSSKVIIVQHFPVVEPFKSKSHQIINSAEYQKILDKHNNVIAVLSGHYHAAKIRKVGNTIHVSTPALVEYPNGFRLITLSEENNKIKVKFEFKETRLKRLQEKSKSRTKSWQLNQGQEADRNTVIFIEK